MDSWRLLKHAGKTDGIEEVMSAPPNPTPFDKATGLQRDHFFRQLIYDPGVNRAISL